MFSADAENVVLREKVEFQNQVVTAKRLAYELNMKVNSFEFSKLNSIHTANPLSSL